MNLKLSLTTMISLGLLASPTLRGAEIKHDLLIIDEGLAQLLRVNENYPAKNWIEPDGHPQGRDMQLIGGGRVLIGHDAGYTEFDIATGKVLKDVATPLDRMLWGGPLALAFATVDTAVLWIWQRLRGIQLSRPARSDAP